MMSLQNDSKVQVMLNVNTKLNDAMDLMKEEHVLPLDIETPIDQSVNQNSWNENKIVYYFNEKHNYLYACFGKKYGERINRFIHGSVVKIYILIVGIIWFLLPWITNSYTWSNQYTIIYPIYTIFIFGISFLCYGILWLLSSNIMACKLIYCSFEFWFKIYLMIQNAVLTTVMWTRFYLTISQKSYEYNVYWYCISILSENMCLIIIVLIASSFDAINIDKKWQIFFSGLCGLIILYLSIYYLIFAEYIWMFNIGIIKISINELNSTSLRILAVFLFKQSILTWINKDKSVLIICKPYIEWRKS